MIIFEGDGLPLSLFFVLNDGVSDGLALATDGIFVGVKEGEYTVVSSNDSDGTELNATVGFSVG